MAGSSRVFKKQDQKQPSSPIPPLRHPWKCSQCATDDTPVKRSGPQGSRTLCNACGIRIRKKNRASAQVGADAAVAAAGMPPQRRARQKMSPPKKKAQTCKRSHRPSPSMKQHRERDELNSIQPKSVSLPVGSVPLAATGPVLAVPSPHVHAANPVAPRVATGIVASLTPAVQPPIASALSLASSATSVQMSAPTVPIQTNTAEAPQAQVPSPICSQRGPNMTPTLCIPPDSSQTAPIAALERSMGGTLASTAVERSGLTDGCSLPFPLQPPTTPESLPMVRAEAPADAMVANFPQSGCVDDRTREEILAALDTGTVTVDVSSAESKNEAKQDNFPGSVFARTDGSGTTSTEVNVLDIFRRIDDGYDSVPVAATTNSLEVERGKGGSMGGKGLRDVESPAGMRTEGHLLPVRQASECVPMDLGGQGALEVRCADALTMLEHMKDQISECMCSIEERISLFATRQEELTVESNEVSLSISQLMGAKDVARKKYRDVSEKIARTTYLLDLLRKQVQFVATAKDEI